MEIFCRILHKWIQTFDTTLPFKKIILSFYLQLVWNWCTRNLVKIYLSILKVTGINQCHTYYFEIDINEKPNKGYSNWNNQTSFIFHISCFIALFFLIVLVIELCVCCYFVLAFFFLAISLRYSTFLVGSLTIMLTVMVIWIYIWLLILSFVLR